ncbi:hypothetical protein HHK36_027503 [Tetracentron sinense]|uniref:Uncharacterized protein n=1 Tax=Tetracentron sinense TaxID=13715 RepID=A0A834YD61_TETSI|nr:hypothetical protein HHK36_027503 [Tetracentron sinense]
MAALLPIPTPPQSLLSKRSSRWSYGSTIPNRPPAKLIPRCSPSTSVVEGPSPSLDGVPIEAQDAEKLPLRGCKACGREELEKGCNGEGRIQGGIATVPGFGWWPIKAFRPCPEFVASGGRYRRRGQSMDEVAFGRGDRKASMGSSDENQSR